MINHVRCLVGGVTLGSNSTIYCDPTPAFDTAVIEQNHKAAAGKKRDLNALLRKGDTWSVEGDAVNTSLANESHLLQ